METQQRKGRGWYATFALLVVATSVIVYFVTGQEALAAAGRFIWNSLVLAANAIIRFAGTLLQTLARGVGSRRLSRQLSVLTGVSLGYAASVVVSDRVVARARGFRGKLRAAVRLARDKWRALPLVVKLLAVAGLIASQIYLHFFLIVFPVAFLVPVVRKLWVRVADAAFGSWYWKTFGGTHRATIAAIAALPPLHAAAGGLRLMRLRYLCAWRLWRHDPRYRDADGNKRHVSFIEPIRLWRRGELDIYRGRPLLSGGRRRQAMAGQTAAEPAPAEDFLGAAPG